MTQLLIVFAVTIEKTMAFSKIAEIGFRGAGAETRIL